MNNVFLSFLILPVLVACGKDPETPPVTLPTGLTTEIIVNAGEVHVTATAQSANFYTSTFYHGTDSTVIQSTDVVAV